MRHHKLICSILLLSGILFINCLEKENKNKNKNPVEIICLDSVGTKYNLAINPFLKPHGLEVGDSFPFFKDGNWHLFALRVKNGGITAIDHLVSKDLIRYELRKPVYEGDCATGSVIENQGKYYMFYTGPGQAISLLISEDLENWIPYNEEPILIADDSLYSAGHFRDPFVFFNEQENCWWMIWGSATVNKVKSEMFAGCVALAKSYDLINWELQDPLIEPENSFNMDCPQLIEFNNKWYLTFLSTTNSCYVSESLKGPWTRIENREFINLHCAASSRMETNGNSWVSWGFTGWFHTSETCSPIKYGGARSIPRKVNFENDDIYVEPVPQLIEALRKDEDGNGFNQNPQRLSGNWNIQDNKISSVSEYGGAILINRIDTIADFYFEADFMISQKEMTVEFVFRTNDNFTDGYRICISPSENQVFVKLNSYWQVGPHINHRHILFDSNKINLKVFVCDDNLEIFVNNKYDLSCKLLKFKDFGKLGIQLVDGNASIENIYIREFDRNYYKR